MQCVREIDVVGLSCSDQGRLVAAGLARLDGGR